MIQGKYEFVFVVSLLAEDNYERVDRRILDVFRNFDSAEKYVISLGFFKTQSSCEHEEDIYWPQNEFERYDTDEFGSWEKYLSITINKKYLRD